MAYVALYRQWRPQDFDNLVGQDHISMTLKNALTTGRIAHAYLFTGPRGTGKTSTAKILAKALNCVNGPTAKPCNQCPNCEKITLGTSMDVFEIDAASNRGIDEIRDLRETVKFAPVDGRYKVYIIDEVHMLTTEAFNALLKTLEEPPGHVIFILATTEPHKIPATIHSRCQRYDFRRIPDQEIETRLTTVVAGSGLSVAPDALRLIVAHADGGMRDALSILDQCSALDAKTITASEVRALLGLIGHEWVWRLTEAVADRDTNTALVTLDELIRLGKDVRQIMLELAQHARSLMLYLAAPEMVLETYSENQAVLNSQSKKFSHAELVDWVRMLHETVNEVKWSPDPRINAEMALVTACRRAKADDIAALAERVAAIEAALSGAQLQPAAPEKSRKEPREIAVKRVAAEPQQSIPARTKETPVNTAPVAQEPVGSASMKTVWEAVLRELLANGKRMVHACVSQGQLIALDDRQAILRFSVPFSKERTEKEDYRSMIEKILAQVTGHSIRLQCILGEEKPVPPPDSPAGTAERPEKVHPAVRQALEIFGGTVIKEQTNEEG